MGARASLPRFLCGSIVPLPVALSAKFLFTVVSGGTSAVIGKKELRQRRAADVLEGGSEWGDDLHPTSKLQ
jgi:hypothetical protein